MINRYYNRTPYQGELYQPNVPLISEVLGQAQKKYDTNFAAAETLKNKYVNALPQDRAVADQIQQATEEEINSIVNKYSGDYSQATKDLTSLISRMEKDYNPGGKAHAIETNYKAYNDSLERERERLKKGEVISAQLAALQGHVSRTYTGIGDKDKITGAYNSLNVPDLAKYVDESKLIDEAFKATPEQKRKEGRTYFENGNQYYQEVETQGKPYDILRESFKDALFGDNAYTVYKDQTHYLAGDNVSPEEFQNDIIQSADRYASTRAYMNTSDILKADRDPVYMENLRHKHRLGEAKYKQKLKDDSDLKQAQDLFGALNIGTSVNRAAGSELGSQWRTRPSSFSSPAYNSITGELYAGSDPFSEITKGQQYTENMYDLMKSGKLKEIAPGVNLNLLESGARDLASKSGFDYDKQSDAWKRNFYKSNEGELQDKYNNDLKNVRTGIADEFAIPDKSSEVLKQQLIPRAMSGNTTVFQVKNGNLTEFQKAGDIGISTDDIYNSNGSIKKGVKVTDYVVPGQFYTKPAYKVVTPNGKEFYITDQNKDRYEYFSSVGDAHSGIFKEGKEWGTSFQATFGNKSISVVPRMKYMHDSAGNVSQQLAYYHVDENGKQDLITNAAGTGPATIYDIWDLEGDRIKSALPLGLSKSQATKGIFDYNIHSDYDDEE